MKYLLCHGFSFSDEYWNNLVPLLDAAYEFFDENKNYDSAKNYIGIGHSIGFQKLNNSGIKFKALIGLQGFLNFCNNDPIILENIDRMIHSFSISTDKSVDFFHKVCGLPQAISNDSSADQLLSDLESMKYGYKHCGYPTMIIGTNDDPIISKQNIIDNFKSLPEIKLSFIEGQHHALGFLNAAEVVQQIQDFLKSI